MEQSEKGTFVVKIQEEALTAQDTSELKRLLVEYINKTNMPPKFLESVLYTLSNCKDTQTDCTCESDD